MFLTEEIPNGWYSKNFTEVQENPDNYRDFKILNGKLYKHFFERTNFTELELSDPWKLCIPENLKTRVLKENHDEPTAGYMGIPKTISRISEKILLARNVLKYFRIC